jgi:DNA-binding transcriptional ArsR family regulator
MLANLREEVHNMHAHICSALADPNRILILYTLANGPANVSGLAEEVNLPQPTVSRHLKVLRESGLVESERDGHSVVYELSDGRVIEALDLLRALLADNLEKQAALARTASESLSKDT